MSWYEANAYCAWLTEHLREAGSLGENEEVRLPSQAEWMAAARCTHGKEYPWGEDEFDRTKANTKESNLEQTTPVHMYRDGRTPDDVWDMSGNVWEWTNDVDTDSWTWSKGGSSYSKGARASASARLLNSPDVSYYGLRVVVVPISRSVLDSEF